MICLGYPKVWLSKVKWYPLFATKFTPCNIKDLYGFSAMIYPSLFGAQQLTVVVSVHIMVDFESLFLSIAGYNWDDSDDEITHLFRLYLSVSPQTCRQQ